MADLVRRKLLTGALVGGAALGMAGRAMAQTQAQTAAGGTDTAVAADQPPGQATAAEANAPQANATAQATQKALQAFNDPVALKVTPVGQDWANLHRYHAANTIAAALPQEQRRAVMMGDSITDNWAGFSGDFYNAHGLIGRGISGQVTAQMLLRFPAEVVALKPSVVHIMAGTNDIAENTDPYDFNATTNNMQAMITLAKANGIAVVMASVPPSTHFSWRPEVGNPLTRIEALNAWIKYACSMQDLTYVDYWPVLQGPDGGLRTELGINGDTVHPNLTGYLAMQPLTLAAIETALTAKHA